MDRRALIANRPQITSSDSFAPCIGAIENAFGWNVDFAMLTKKHASDSSLPDVAHRYTPGHVTGVDQTVIEACQKTRRSARPMLSASICPAEGKCGGLLDLQTDSAKSWRATPRQSRYG
jgi:hypothetical protein